MKNKFEVIFLDEAALFIDSLEEKERAKIYFNIRKSRTKVDNELLKKLQGNIWEFRTLYNNTHFRLFAFWDKTEKSNTLVVTTHGIIKKTDKTPQKEIEKAENIRELYFESKNEE